MSEKDRHIQEEVEKTMSLLDLPTMVPVPEGFMQRLEEKLEKQEPAPHQTFGWKRVIQIAALIAAIAVNFLMYSQDETTEVDDTALSDILSDYGWGESDQIW